MDTASEDTPVTRPKWQKGLLISAIALAGLAAILIVGVIGLNTGPGRAFLVRQIVNLQLESGMKVHIKRIDGSLYSRFTVHDLRLHDLDGEFLHVPQAEVDWRPQSILSNHFVLNRVYAPSLTLHNIPRLNDVPTDPDEPLFPDIDVTVGEARVDRIVIGPKVAGQQYVAEARASGLLRDGLLKLNADASADAGDRMKLKAAIGPDKDMLDLSALLTAPVGGLVSGMAGLDKPLVLTLDGTGSWKKWDGALASRLADDQLLDFQIAGRNGTFTMNGHAAPALVLEEGPATRLLVDGLDIRSTVGFDLPNITLSADVSAPAFTVKANGGLNADTSRLEAVKVDARLSEPAAIMEGVSGEDVVLTALLNGPMVAPEIQFDAQAKRIGYDATQVNGLKAAGTVTMSNTGDMTVPVTLSLASVDGLPDAAKGLLNRFKLDGVVQVSPEAVSAEKVAFSSQYLSGQAGFRQVLASGAYTANVDAKLLRYAVPEFGVVEGTLKGTLGSDANGVLTMNGDVRAQALRLDNDSAREFLGGPPVLEASVRQLADGRIVVRKGVVQAPRLQFAVSRGVYTPDGRIDLAAAGKSAVYGPFALEAKGPAMRPAVRATAANPDLGLGLKDLVLTAAPKTGGYFVTLAGQSSQGDLSGRARVLLDRGPLAADIEELRLADMSLKGRVEQTKQGPFQGVLALNGAGLAGTVQLAAEGSVQRADASIQARRARPPVLPGLAIGDAALKASVRLPESGPDVNGKLDARLIQYGQWRIEKASGTANFANGSGKADLSLAGRYKTPFEMALTATAQPNRAQLALNGSVNGRRIRMAEPAVAEKTQTGWRLLPATVTLAGGRLNFEGETGETTKALASWTGLNLRFLDAFDPELGFSGSASGTLSYVMPANGQMPNADLRMVISRLQRAGLTTVSPPLDLGINATLKNHQAAMRMLLRHEKSVVGSMQAKLALAPSNAWNWTDQLWTAPMQGGLRFNGPVDVLWAMSGLKDQELGGTLAVSADLGGTLSQPLVTGSVTTQQMTYENVAFGTRVDDLALNARFEGSRVRLVSLSGTTPGKGRLSAQNGYIDLNPAQNFPMDLTVTLTRFQAARTDNMEATLSGPITIRRDANGGVIAGRITIDEARYRFTGMAAAEVPQLDVQRVGDVPAEASQTASKAEPNLDFNLRLRVEGDNRIFIQGMGLDSEWKANLLVGGTLFEPHINGKVEVVRGNYAFAGRRFDLNRGIIQLGGEFPPNPTLDIEAGATVDGVEALLLVSGPALKPKIAFSSVPALPEDEILSRLLFGGSAAELSATEALQLAAAVASLQGGGGGMNPLGKMRQITKVDRLRIVGADETTGRGTSLAVGQYLTDNVYVEVSSDTHGNTLTQLEIGLTKALSILSQVGQTGQSSLNLQYKRDY